VARLNGNGWKTRGGGKAATDSDVASIILIAFPLQVRWKSAIMQMHFCLQF